MVSEGPDTIARLQAELAALRRRITELEQQRAAQGLDSAAQQAVIAALQREQDFNRVLLENLAEGVVACDAEGELRLFNHVSRTWHGLDAEPLPPERWAERYNLYEEDGATPLVPGRIPLLRALQGEHVRDAAMVIAARGQAPRQILASGDPLVDSQGRKIGAVVVMHDITERKRKEEALQQSLLKEELIRTQAALLAELSTPIIPITHEALVMPLIGAIDLRRAQQITEALLTGIARRRARTAILDITGVPTIDAAVAEALVRGARGAGLLGAEVMLSGVRPEVAQTLVDLGIDLDTITTHHSLQDCVQTVLSRVRPKR